MDVSDLPVPLSRIEKLWNCLITGETPDFEPLSRNEKYLMAMLDRYDISNLPAPTSRGEKLLYKIAVGETDLSDVPGYLSRYEELLKYLIENGGISGGDFEYVLYTLNQSLSTLYTTAEKPVKSAILSGQTLVNILGDYPEQTFTLDNTWQPRNIPIEYTNLIKPNTTYTFVFNVTECQMADSTKNNFQIGDDHVFNNGVNLILKLGVNTYKLTTKDSITFPLRLYGSAYNSGTLTFNLMLLEGDYVGQNIPHFNGMQSVKLPVLTTMGENLIDSEIIAGWLNTSNGEINNLTSTATCATKDLIKVKPATQYSVFKEYNKRVLYAQFNEKQEFINFNTYTHNGFTTDSNAVFVRLFFETPVNEELKVMLYEGGYNSNISYEPFKSNILTVNEEVTLRGIGEVQDTLDCLSGEVTQRIGEIVLDGSENWELSANFSSTYNAYYFVSNETFKPNLKVICDKYEITSYSEIGKTIGLAIGTGGDKIAPFITSDKMTLSEFKEYLSKNPTTIQYELATTIIKTVDLTTVDQDNQPTQLGTFKNVTHVSLKSAGLIPTLEMEVATKISAELASASPLMDDISTEQERLNTTVDEQSNNVDATMIATTEIYEETL